MAATKFQTHTRSTMQDVLDHGQWLLTHNPPHPRVNIGSCYLQSSLHICKCLTVWFRNFVGRFQTLGQNRNTYQSLNSNVCGHYCIYVAAQYGHTGSFESLPDITPNRFYAQNDAVVAHIASVCLDVEDVISNSTRSGQCCCSFVQKAI